MKNALITLGIVLAGWFILGVTAASTLDDTTMMFFADMFVLSLIIGSIAIGVMFIRERQKKKNQIKTAI